MGLDAADDYRETCDSKGCDEEFDTLRGLSVPWADVSFCSRECRDQWANAQVNHDLR